MRGKATSARGADTRQRFIHANAGESERDARLQSQIAVHPREGGVKSSSVRISLSGWGSSTRRRGRARGLLGRAQKQGFIPAKAGGGKDSSPPCGSERYWFIHAKAGESVGGYPRHDGRTVHPRERGGKVIDIARQATEQGSSPRTRGKVLSRHLDRTHRRFIPANAGER